MDDIDRLADILKEAIERMGGGNSRSSESYASLPAEEKQKKLLEDTNKKFKALNEQLEKSRKKQVDLTHSFADLDDMLADVDDGIERTEKELERAALGAKYFGDQSMIAGKKFMLAIGDTLIKGTINGTKNLVKGLQDGSSSVRIATDYMSNSIDMTQSSYNALGAAAGSVGGAMTAAGGKTGKFGVAVTLASQAFTYFTGVASDLAKFGLEVMAKEVEKTIKSYNDVNAAGAVFADGMMGMRNSAKDSGLTLEQFSKAVTSNSVSLAESGLTVAGATKKMGTVLRAGGDNFKQNLMRLGYNIDEHAGLVADTMAIMRRSNMLSATTDPQQIAAATESYAKNLRIIANITGENAQQAMKETQKKNMQYAVDAALREKAAKSADPAKFMQNANAYLAVLDKTAPEIAEAQRQILVTGATTNAAVAGSGMDRSLRGVVDSMDKGNFDLKSGLSQLKTGTDRFAGSVTDATGQATAISSLMGAGNDNFATFYTNAKTLGIALQDPVKAIDGVNAAMTNRNAETDQLIQNELDVQRLRIGMEAEFTKHLGEFNQMVSKIIGELAKTLNRMGNIAGGGTGKTGLQDAGHILGSTATYAGTGAMIGTAFGPGPGTAIGAGVGATVGLGVGLYDAAFGSYANGGISSGPLSGYQAQLHGTEAVVPLPDGKSIPVEMKDSGNAATAKLMSQVVEELQRGNQMSTTNFQNLIRAMKDGNSLTSGILQNSY